MKEKNLIINISLKKEDAEMIRAGINTLYEYHIGRIFGEHVLREYKKNGGENKEISIVMPLKLKDYLLEPGNIFDSIKDLVSSIIKQIDEWDGRRLGKEDGYGKILKAGISDSEYGEYKKEALNFPEYHAVRVFLEDCMEKIRDNSYSVLTGKSQASEDIGTGHLPCICSLDRCYFSYELLSFAAHDVKEEEEVMERKKAVTYNFILGK